MINFAQLSCCFFFFFLGGGGGGGGGGGDLDLILAQVCIFVLKPGWIYMTGGQWKPC